METELFIYLITGIVILVGVSIILIIRHNRIKAELIALTDNMFDDLCNPQMRSTMYCINTLIIHVNREQKPGANGMVNSPTIYGSYKISFWYEERLHENEIGVALWKNKKRLYRRMGCIKIPKK